MTRSRKRNRKKQAATLNLHAPTIALITVFATVLLCYLWLCGRCEDLGKNIKRLEQDLERQRRMVLTEEFNWSTMKSQTEIRKYLHKQRLVMDWPDEAHVVRIPLIQRHALDREETPPDIQFARTDPGIHHD